MIGVRQTLPGRATFLAFLVAAGLGLAPVASAQDQLTDDQLIVELDFTAGNATEDRVKAASAQFRGFGQLKSGIRFNLEGTWGQRSDNDTDAFGAAYPYGGSLELSEAYAERIFQRRSRLVGIRVGRYAARLDSPVARRQDCNKCRACRLHWRSDADRLVSEHASLTDRRTLQISANGQRAWVVYLSPQRSRAPDRIVRCD